MSTLLRINGILIMVILAAASLNVPAAGTGDVAARLQLLEDREAIRDLLAAYGSTLDARDFKGFSELFARDVGEWNGGMGVARGPAAIRTLMEKTIGSGGRGTGSHNFHIFSNARIELHGDRATAVSKWAFIVQGDDGKPQLVYLGHYDDKLIRQDGRWKFLQRKVTTDIPGEKQ